MARALYWLHAIMAILTIAFFVSTMAISVTLMLHPGRMNRCKTFSLLRVNPQGTNSLAIDDEYDNGIVNTPAAPATLPRVRTSEIAVSGLGRTLRKLKIVIVNKNGTTIDQAAVPEQQPKPRHDDDNNNNNDRQQQILRLAQWPRGKRGPWRRQRLRAERKKKKAEAWMHEQLTGREHEGNADGQQTLGQRLRAAPGRQHHRVLREFVLAHKKAEKSNRNDRRDGNADRVLAKTALLQGPPGRPLPIWVL